MANIGPITLRISRAGENALIEVFYGVLAETRDLATQQPYREICRLIGDDTPGDGADDIVADGTLFNAITVFTESSPEFTRVLNRTLPLSNLNEDTGELFPDDDEIRAVVSLTPLEPAVRTRESNQVILKAFGNQNG
jgi:hypothetical protein